MPTEEQNLLSPELKEALVQNQALLEKIYEAAEKTRRYIFWLKVLAILKLVLVIVPIIILLIFVLPMLKDVIQMYSGLLKGDAF